MLLLQNYYLVKSQDGGWRGYPQEIDIQGCPPIQGPNYLTFREKVTLVAVTFLARISDRPSINC